MKRPHTNGKSILSYRYSQESFKSFPEPKDSVQERFRQAANEKISDYLMVLQCEKKVAPTEIKKVSTAQDKTSKRSKSKPP